MPYKPHDYAVVDWGERRDSVEFPRYTAVHDTDTASLTTQYDVSVIKRGFASWPAAQRYADTLNNKES